ncbi:hypothetical protein L2D14_00450 [Thalassospiraceae bacterium LMO-JJ14]|nr:hypothetical protein L2D14_00450 [Thalassospiraceae bacterium LMO-JJ14]
MPKIIKIAMLVAVVSAVPVAAYAHGSGSGMMQGQGYGMGPGMMGQQGYGMGPGMMGQQGYGMGPGMMGQQGYGMGPGMMGQQGYGMGPGMMGPGMMGPGMMNMMHGMMMGRGMTGWGYGIGPGMMGQGYGMGPGMMGAAGNREVTEDDVRGFLGRQLEMHGLTRLKVGSIDTSDDKVFKADIVTKEDSLVMRVVVDRRSGFPVAFE